MTRVDVGLFENPEDDLAITIKDNGIGITESQMLNPGFFGIIGMNERMQQLGGRPEVYGSSSAGSVVILRIPLTSIELFEESIND